MVKKWYLSLFLLMSLNGFCDESVETFQKRLKETIAKTLPAFVFIGGGSGTVISPDGYIITNYHVAGATGKKWRVKLSGGKAYKAQVVGHDPYGDLALLKIENAKDLPYLELADSDKLEPGQEIITIGNPFLVGSENYEPTVTLGIVSLIHRYFESYNDAIQIDAAINPGNSGGALVTLDGKLAGVNGMINVRFYNRVNTGVGYAIPANQIKRLLPSLKKGGRIYHGYVDGLTITDSGDERYENVGEYGDGVLVVSIDKDSPADKAGLEPGDIILDVEGSRTFNTKRFHGAVGTYPVGEKVKMRVKRDKETRNLEVTLGVQK